MRHEEKYKKKTVKFQIIPTYSFWEKLDEKFLIYCSVLSKQSRVQQEIDVWQPLIENGVDLVKWNYNREYE